MKFFIKTAEQKPLKWYFVLKSRNGQVLMTSETYNRRSSAAKAISAILAAGLKATVQEK